MSDPWWIPKHGRPPSVGESNAEEAHHNCLSTCLPLQAGSLWAYSDIFIGVLPPLTESELGWGPDAQDMELWEVIAVSLQGSADTWKRSRIGEAGKLESSSTWAIT